MPQKPPARAPRSSWSQATATRMPQKPLARALPAGGFDGFERWLPGRPCLTLLSAPVKNKVSASVRLAVRPSVRPSVCRSVGRSVCLSVCLSVCRSVCLPVCLFVCCLGKASGGVWWIWTLAARSAVPNVAFCPCKNKVSAFVRLAVRPSVRLSVCVCVCRSVGRSVCLSLSPAQSSPARSPSIRLGSADSCEMYDLSWPHRHLFDCDSITSSAEPVKGDEGSISCYMQSSHI